MANPGSYGSTPTTSAPSSTPAAPAASAGAGGSFPQTPTGTGLGVNGMAVANISVNDFLSNYDISSTEENTFVQQGTKGPELTQNALMLMQYQAMDPTERQTYQEAMVNAGLLPAGDANGTYNSASVTAFKNAVSTSAAQGIQVTDFLQQYTGTNNVNTALASATGRAEQEAQAPVTANLENPTTLNADLINAFDQALGYSSTPEQQAAFAKAIQGQDVAVAQAPHEAAQAQLALLKSDQSALTKLGPNGIDSVITAYTNAIHGINPSAGNPNSPQGPQNGSTVQPGQPGSMGPAGPIGMKSSAAPIGIGGAFVHNITNPAAMVSPLSMQTSEQPTAPGAPQWQPGPGAKTNPTYGGVYALTPADWTEAKKLTPAASKFATAGSAPLNIQQSAFTNLLQNVYDNNGGSWADAIITIAGGTVGKAASEKELGSSTNLQTFATGIANEVNNQLTSLANTVNTQNVTEKVTAPDAQAEAALAAKSADPVGYTAANAATAGSLLNQMLAGAPQMYGQTTADTFSGPAVGAGEATSSTAVA